MCPFLFSVLAEDEEQWQQRSGLREQQPDPRGSKELHAAASTLLAALPALPTQLNPAPQRSVGKKKKSKRESSHSKPQTMSQIMPRSTEVLPLPSHALVEEGRRKRFPPAQLAASWNLGLAQLALPSSSSCVFSNGLFLRRAFALLHHQPPACSCPWLGGGAALGVGRRRGAPEPALALLASLVWTCSWHRQIRMMLEF